MFLFCYSLIFFSFSSLSLPDSNDTMGIQQEKKPRMYPKKPQLLNDNYIRKSITYPNNS